jgi:hypothetical protein
MAPAPWPYCALHAHPGFQRVWRDHFGRAQARHLTLRGADLDLPCLITRSRRVLELGERFVIAPEDAAFVHDRRKRLLPLRQLSPAISLEAGNLRGGGAITPENVTALALALRAARGWDYAQFPVPQDSCAPLMRVLAAQGLRPIARATGRVFKAHLDFADWEDLLSRRSRNFRKNIKRMDQALAGAQAQIDIWQGADLTQGFALFEACATQSWKARSDAADVTTQGVNLPLTARQIAFHQALDQQEGLDIIIATLRDQGRCVGAMMWAICDGWMTGTLTYFDPAGGHLSPGHALMRMSLQWAHARGLRQVDFNATGTWLDAYTNTQSPFSTLILTPPGLWGKALHRLARRSGQGVTDLQGANAPGARNVPQV